MFPYDNNYQPNYGYGIFPQQDSSRPSLVGVAVATTSNFTL